MAYTPINWDENTPVDATKLNQMDNQIDTNENDLRTIQGGEASVDGRITQNESDISNLRNVNNVSYSGKSSLRLPPNSWTNFNQTGIFIFQANDYVRIKVNGYIINDNLNNSEPPVAQLVISDGSNVSIYNSYAERSIDYFEINF